MHILCITSRTGHSLIGVTIIGASLSEPHIVSTTGEMSIYASGKNFVKITSVGMGAAKSNETR